MGLALLYLAWRIGGAYVFFYTAVLILVLDKLLVLLANWLNSPMEKAISKWYYNDAARKLAKFKDLIIIGVTGSYGKTSTKNYLYRILSEKYNTLITPGNFNTLLGVVRTIREQLQPMHQVFIVEMGESEPFERKIHYCHSLIVADGRIEFAVLFGKDARLCYRLMRDIVCHHHSLLGLGGKSK